MAIRRSEHWLLGGVLVGKKKNIPTRRSGIYLACGQRFPRGKEKRGLTFWKLQLFPGLQEKNSCSGTAYGLRGNGALVAGFPVSKSHTSLLLYFPWGKLGVSKKRWEPQSTGSGRAFLFGWAFQTTPTPPPGDATKNPTPFNFGKLADPSGVGFLGDSTGGPGCDSGPRFARRRRTWWACAVIINRFKRGNAQKAIPVLRGPSPFLLLG